MNRKTHTSSRKLRCSSRPICKKCRSSRRCYPHLRKPVWPASAKPDTSTKLQIVGAIYAYVMNSWEDLPEQSKRAPGFDFVVGSDGEEVALNHLARLFMACADLSFRKALVARRMRLGLYG